MKNKTFIALILVVMMLCLTACGSKTQPTPTAAPTAVPTEPEPTAVPTEVEPTAAPTEAETVEEAPAAEPKAETEVEAEAETASTAPYDPDDLASVFEYYKSRGSRIFQSYAFMQLNTEGKTTWAAPLVGIEEFKVPEAFLEAKGGIRASGGEEVDPGSGVVSIDIVYLPFTEAEYNDFVDRIAKFEEEHDDPTDEDIETYYGMIGDYNSNVYTLFSVYGIGSNGSADDLKAALKKIYMSSADDEETAQIIDAFEVIEAGSADDYNFYLVKDGNRTELFTEEQADYTEEYTALYDAVNTYAENFTFMKPLGLAQLVAEGTGLTFETKDLNGNDVNSAELFGSHKATMVNIWETTCSACMSEMPALKKLAEEFEAKGGQIVGLVYDAVEEDLVDEAKDIASDLGLNFVNLIPTQEMNDFFMIQAFPTTYFFNEKGEVVGEPVIGASPDRYIAVMNGLLGE